MTTPTDRGKGDAEDSPYGLDPEIGKRMLDQLFSIWVEPEVRRRQVGGKLPADAIIQVTKAQVIFPSQLDGGAPEVRLNDEARIVATFKPAPGREIKAGQPLYEDDIESFENLRLPEGEDINAGHITALCFRGVWTIAFDGRRNLDHTRHRLELADKYFQAAAHSRDLGLQEPALENLWAAAELAAIAELGTIFDDVLSGDHRAHLRREQRLAEWVKLGNAPAEADRVLAQLSKGRAGRRYGEQNSLPTDEGVEAMFNKVKEMIDHAKGRLADWGLR